MMAYQDNDRYAVQRGRYLSKATELRKKEATAVAYTELGYSWGGVAREMDTTKGTISGYLERAMARYGLEICEYKVEEEGREDSPDYEPVEAGYHDTRTEKGAEQWVEYVERHQDTLPQEWVASVLMAAREDGF